MQMKLDRDNIGLSDGFLYEKSHEQKNRKTIDGWTIAEDSKYPLEYTKSNTFVDDDKISSWAKDSVYFMNANGIINGVGDNKFAPKNVTSAEEAVGYANVTREQAIIIATRMVKNLK